jgi:putative holliday junction resolvase
VSRFLALDLGARRIGAALSDPSGTVATPLVTFEHRSLSQDVRRVAEMCAAHAIAGIVVGWPRNMDGSRGSAARRAEKFAQELRRALRLPVDLWDERLSTIAAERALIEVEVRRAARRGLRDRVAAAIILQSYLDARGARSGLPRPGA